MVDAVVSVVLDQLISSAFEEAVERVRRVTAVKAEVDKLTSNLLAIKAVLSDAEQKQVKEKGIRHWLDQLKEASCDMEDVFDEWITASRRLQIKGIPQEKKELEDVFKQFTCLRALRICGENVWEIGNSKIPKAMKNLIHLRFLKLSWLRIKELPETCCELINLETLEINRCTRLKRLPQGMEKLMNLRHLIIMNHVYLEYMPRGIERLTGLRTLSEFVVGRTGGEHASKVCKLEALKGMNHLRGLLKIRMLGDLANVDEAKHVDLKEKKNLDRLELWFDNVGMPNENEENDEAITKVLQLPPNLEYLGILHYRGRSLIFPNWIESFNKLKKLLFIDCKKCESMPPLGQLPSLEVLTIWYMDSVERVGDEFLGIENSCLHGISSSSSSSLATAFPKLKHLTIKGSKKWDEWYFAKEDITIMPQLNSLDISLCNNLKSLPDQILQSKTLENLTIEKCPILEVRFKKDTGEEWPKISHIPSIRIGHWYV
ncbi:hypothetical protein KPL71_021835 [Citrus sinensis]|uniref:Uncharacterized protein n=1 Tax=Citrus sinensis TaxID=2711 RepID=A0ACB8JIF8_CITSI|nr:hypothetical protein KPL71_021835 [Citrus sinensis]